MALPEVATAYRTEMKSILENASKLMQSLAWLDIAIRGQLDTTTKELTDIEASVPGSDGSAGHDAKLG